MTPSEHARAAAILAVHVLLLVLAAPGVETVVTNGPNTPWATMVRAWDRSLRGGLEARVAPVERVLGVRQSWQFYRTGASKVRRFEIWVDGELWSRSGDPDHAFLSAPLANPRLRHLAKDWVRGRGLRHQRGLLAYVVAQVRAADPDATSVRLIGTESPWPGRDPVVVRDVSAEAPSW